MPLSNADFDSSHVFRFFAGWGGYHMATTQADLQAGFEDWAWDARDETLEVLRGERDDAQLVDDILYSLRQCEEFQHLSASTLTSATRAFLDEGRDTLVDALDSSLLN